MARRLAPVFALVLFSVAAASAQSGRGTISGLVGDTSGAGIPLVGVVATNQDTGVATTVHSDERGLYSLLNLPVGEYIVTFTKNGFASLTQKGVHVGVQSAVTLNATLTVGNVTDAVTVTADAPLLEARN